MPGLAVFPILEMLSHSASAADRASFVRVFVDYSAFLRQRDVEMPGDWLAALKTCLQNARSEERNAHTAALSKVAFGVEYSGAGPRFRVRPSDARSLDSEQSPTFRSSNRSVEFAEGPATGENDEPPFGALANEETEVARAPTDVSAETIADLLRDGDIDALVGLASNRFARLRTEEIGRLVNRARDALEASGDRRLAQAVLARTPIRIEMAPLFLEATSDQRWAIMLAAQRAELGRRNVGAFATVGRETIARLEYAAIAGNMDQFHDLLARAIGAPRALAARISEDPTGEPLVMALVATGAPNDVCVRILAANDMREHGRFLRLHALSRLSGGASPLAARRILAAIVAAQRQVAPVAAPQAAAPLRQLRLTPSLRADASPKARAAQPRKASTVGAK